MSPEPSRLCACSVKVRGRVGAQQVEVLSTQVQQVTGGTWGALPAKAESLPKSVLMFEAGT